MANRKAQLNLRKQRKEKLKEEMEEFEDMFPFENITNAMTKPRAKSSMLLKTQPAHVISSNNLEEVKQIRESQLNRYNQKMQLFYDMRTKFKNKQVEGFKKHQEEFMEKMKENVEQQYSSEDEEKRKKIVAERMRPRTNIEKRPEKPFPGPGQYDIAGDLNLNMGYTFGAKLPNPSDINIKYAPKYVKLESDIEEMMRKTHQTFTSNKRFERFTPIKPPYEPLTTEEKEKLLTKKHNFDNLKKYDKFELEKDYIRNLKEKREENLKKRELPRMRETPNENIPGPGHYDPYYNDYNPQMGGKPEDAFIPKDFDIQGPKFSITGKPAAKGFLGPSANDDKFNALDQSLSFLSKNPNELPKLPDYNVTKDNLPIFSFPRSQRFTEDINSKFPGPNEYFKETDIEKQEKERMKNPNQRL